MNKLKLLILNFWDWFEISFLLIIIYIIIILFMLMQSGNVEFIYERF